MARRSEHSQEQIREMVLNAAETIIVEEGVESLTVRKIAMEIGYTVGSIYMVFANMQDLMMHVKGRTLDMLAAELQQLPATGDIEQQIGGLAAAYLGFAAENYNRWRIVFESGIESSAALPDWYREKIERMFQPIESLFGQLTPNRGPEQAGLAARALWCGVHGVCVLYLNGNLGRAGAENAETAVRLLVENFIRGWQQS